MYNKRRMKKILFLINPISGRQAGRNLQECIISELRDVLERDRFDIEFSRQNIRDRCNTYLSNYEIVVVASGDGTVSRVVKEIVRLDKKPKLGIIPIGTGNDLANSAGILQFYKSQGLKALLKMILRGNVTHVDIMGIDNKHLFTNYLGIGNDAKIVSDFDRLRYTPVFRNISSYSSNRVVYGLLGLKNIFYRIPFEVEARFRNNHSVTEILSINKGTCGILVTNTHTYAGGVTLSSKCRMNDGMFEVTVIRDIREWLYMSNAMLLNKPLDTVTSNLLQFQTDKLELEFSGESFYHIDGERHDGFPKGEKKLMINVISSLEMIVP